MTPRSLDRTIETLTRESPSYMELIDLYWDLQEPVETEPKAAVAQRALAQVIGEIIDYLDHVSDDLEKAVGLTRTQERSRILETLEKPNQEDEIQQVYKIIDQWQQIERYSFEEFDSDQPDVAL